jgi:hypothetical protein
LKAAKLDEYAVKARVFPALVALLPLSLAASTCTSIHSLFLAISTLIGGTTFASFALAQWSRDLGKSKEPKLFELWDGKPTTHYLRHRNGSENEVLRRLRKNQLEKMAYGIVLPSISAELENPDKADEQYEAVSKILIQKTRDKERFHLLHQELISYGFRRNLWGLKFVALCLVGAAVLLHAILLLLRYQVTFNTGCLVADSFIYAIWVFGITPAWVYVAAKTYSDRLFDCLESLPDASPRI